MGAETKKMHEIVAEKIIEQLKQGTAPWQLPWEKSQSAFVRPYNAVTQQDYKGLNSIYLQMFSPYEDPRWATFKQAQSQGWQVEKGAKGMAINFVKTHSYYPKRDEKGQPVLDENGKPVKVRKELSSPIVTKARVFNAEQIKGITPLERKEETSLWEKASRVENLVKNAGAYIEHVRGDRAFYSPLSDKIRMPDRTQFTTSDRYYSTLLHELGHWTGHRDRLDRSIMNTFGTEEYAREELRAEIASMMVGSEMRIGHDPKQHVAYVDSWIQILTEKPFEIHQAAADSQKIYDFLLAYERKRDLTKNQEISAVRESAKAPEIMHPEKELSTSIKTGR